MKVGEQNICHCDEWLINQVKEISENDDKLQEKAVKLKHVCLRYKKLVEEVVVWRKIIRFKKRKNWSSRVGMCGASARNLNCKEQRIGLERIDIAKKEKKE